MVFAAIAKNGEPCKLPEMVDPFVIERGVSLVCKQKLRGSAYDFAKKIFVIKQLRRQF